MADYMLLMDFLPVDDKRYRYFSVLTHLNTYFYSKRKKNIRSLCHLN